MDWTAPDWTTPIYVLIALILVLVNGFFVLAEFALVKVRATRLEELSKEGNRRARLANEMVKKLDDYLSVTQLGITVASLGLGWIGEPAFGRIIAALVGLPTWWSPRVSHSISAVAAFAIITFLHIWIGELAPKSMALRRAEQSALAIAYPLRWAHVLFYVPMRILNGASNWLLRQIGLGAARGESAHTDEELRMLLSIAQTRGEISLNRLLVLENIFDLGNETVRDAMVAWPEVKFLTNVSTAEDVVRAVTEHRFSRWPVMDARTGKPLGYLLAKDLVATSGGATEWQRLMRPLRVVGPGESLESVLLRLQRDGANMAIVIDQGRPIGLIALEDILEEIVGRIEDEYPRLPKLFLKEAIASGGVSLDFEASTPEEAIRALAKLIPADRLPAGADIAPLAVARERELPTDMGEGVAIPHARCSQLRGPVLVFGRSAEPIMFSKRSAEGVRLVFLLVTPTERPNLQVFMLNQIASIAHSEFVRERLIRARTPAEVIEIIDAADPAVTG